MRNKCHEINSKINKDCRRSSNQIINDLALRFSQKSDGTGYVYLLEFPDKIFKYGYTTDLKERMRTYLCTLKTPPKFTKFSEYCIRYIIETDKPTVLERELNLEGEHISHLGWEYIRLDDDELKRFQTKFKRFIRSEIDAPKRLDLYEGVPDMCKISRQVMFSPRANEYLESLPPGQRSGYVDSLVIRDIEKREKAARKASP